MTQEGAWAHFVLEKAMTDKKMTTDKTSQRHVCYCHEIPHSESPVAYSPHQGF